MGRYLKSFIVQIGKDILIRFPKKVLLFGTFIKEFNQFKSRNDRRFSVTTSDMYPCLKDKVSTTPIRSSLYLSSGMGCKNIKQNKTQRAYRFFLDSFIQQYR